MHNRLFVTVSLPDNATSKEARRSVYNILIADNSFISEGGRFGCSLCDWFVIGGRWSGFFAETLLGQEYQTAVATLNASFSRLSPSPDNRELHRKASDALWCEHGGTGPRPETRDSYEELGYADDAMLLSDPLYATFLAEYSVNGESNEYIDLDGDELQPDFVGRKWLVVVDYHN
jgi:hypothetical protein